MKALTLIKSRIKGAALVFLLMPTPSALATDITNLTNSVMNGWRADFQTQMSSIISAANCSSSVNLTNLTDAVMNGWRADFQNQMGSLVSCSRCETSVDMTTLTNSVMNGWRADFQNQMTSLLQCIGSK